MKKMIKRNGSCFCGRVKFSVNLDEIPRVYNCHCVDCRKKAGGGFITIIELREGALEIDENKLAIYKHPGGSGKEIQKHFCKNFFAPVYSYVERWNKVYLYAGLLDDVEILKTSKNINFEKSYFPIFEIKEKGVKI